MAAYTIRDRQDEIVATVSEIDAKAREQARTNDGYIEDHEGHIVFDSNAEDE